MRLSRGHPRQTSFKITSEYVAVRDGTKLAVDIYRPVDKDGRVVETPLPVVWMHTPYSRASPIEGEGLSMAEIYPGDATAENAAANGLVYETPALANAVQITGHAQVDIWLASSANDSDVVAYVQNVAPDGSVTSYSMNGRQRASLRKEAPAPYNNLGLPWHPFREGDVEPLTPGEPVRLRFDVLPFSMVFDKGHKIRLILTFADAATPKLTPVPVVSIYRDAAHPSLIELPIIER